MPGTECNAAPDLQRTRAGNGGYVQAVVIIQNVEQGLASGTEGPEDSDQLLFNLLLPLLSHSQEAYADGGN